MKKLLTLLWLSIFLLPLNTSAQNQTWYYPIQGFESRNQYKTFDQYWSKSDYKGKEALFPTQYTGYHVADDLEINKGEENQNVPVYAVSDGKITFAGPVGGYGGVILLNIANDSHTALYGHIKLSSLKVKAGDSVKAGQELAYLGNAFSSETGGERKHLHFGIYNGKDIYYHGYEASVATVRSKWIDPSAYLKQKGAKDVSQQTLDVSAKKENSNQNAAVENININSNDNIANPENTAPSVIQNSPIKNQDNSVMNNLLRYLQNIISKIKSVI